MLVYLLQMQCLVTVYHVPTTKKLMGTRTTVFPLESASMSITEPLVVRSQKITNHLLKFTIGSSMCQLRSTMHMINIILGPEMWAFVQFDITQNG